MKRIFLLRKSVDVNGPGRLVLATALELKNLNFIPIVITTCSAKCTNRINVFKNHDIHVEIVRRNSFLMFFDIFRLVLKFKPAIYHSFSYSTAVYGDFFRRLNLVSKAFLTINGFGSEQILKYLKKTEIIVPSIFMKNRIKNLVNIETKLIYPCSPEMYLETEDEKIQSETNLVKKQLVIGSLVRDFDVKGIPFFLQTLAMLKFKGKKVKGLIGGCEDKKYLKLIHEFGIEDIVEFLGITSRVSNFFSRIDIYSQFSIIESFGISVLEAMRYGIPVVLPRIDAFEELIIEHKTGLLFNRSDCTDAVDKILKLYNNDKLYKKMQVSARNRAWNNFGPEVFSLSLKRVYGLQ